MRGRRRVLAGTDQFVFMVRGTAQMFITGPDVVQAVTGEVISMDALGGADTHATVSGLAGFAYDDEESCLEDVRYLLSLLPSNNRELPPHEATGDPAGRRTEALLDLVPSDPNRAYDMRAVIREVVDDGEFFEVHERWAPNMVCALSRLDGHVVGIIANPVGTGWHFVLDELSPPAGPPECFRRHPAGMPCSRMPNSFRYSTVS